MSASHRGLLAFVLLAGCGAPPSPTRPASAETAPLASHDAGSAPVLAAPLSTAPPASPPAAAAPASFAVLFDGACTRAHVGHLGSTPAYAFEQNVVWFDGTEPRELYRDRAPVHSYGGTHSYVGDVGGPDAAHAWVARFTPSRGEGHDGSVLFAARGWKQPPRAKGSMADAYDSADTIEQPDGSLWAYATESFYNDGADTNHFVAWSPSGDLLDTRLPRGDMQGSKRLASGELVVGARSKKNKVVLRRWSPKQAVTDLVAESSIAVGNYVDIQVGTDRAVLSTEASKGKQVFYTYDGAALTAVDLVAASGAQGTWLLTRADDLHVVVGEELAIQHRDGRTERVRLPEPGALAGDPVHVWWMGLSGSLYARSNDGWTKVVLPESPWAQPDHGATKLEYVMTVGTETVVGTSRVERTTDKKKKPVTMRAVYSSGSHGEPARCGSPGKPGELTRR